MVSLFEYIKSLVWPINRDLLRLKVCFFVVYSVWVSVMPYVSLISTKIIDYQQLAILFSCVPAISILTPIITGFVADKMGNYKMLLVCSILLGGFIYVPVPWLLHGFEELSAVSQQANGSKPVNESLNNQTETTWSSSVPQYSYTFPVLLIIRLLGFISWDATNNLIDSCGLSMSKKYGGDFGKQKMWGTFSLVILPAVCGLLIDIISEYRGFKDYSIVFYIGAGFAIVSIPLVFMLDVEVERNKKSLIKTAKAVMGMIDVDVFILVQVIIGFCWGFHATFVTIYVIDELGASKTLLGLALGLGGFGSVIIINYTKPIVDRLGAANAMSFGLMLYCLRFTAYNFLRNPWVMLAVESVDGLSGFLPMVAGSYFCAEAAPIGMLASLNGLLAGAVFGAGRGMGTTVGSILISNFGIRYTYQVFGILAGATSLAYLILYHSVLKKLEHQRLTLAASHSNNVNNMSIITKVGIENPASDSKETDN